MKIKSRYRFISFILIMIFMLTMFPAGAAQIKQVKKQQHQIHSAIQEKKQDIEDKQNQYNAELSHLQNIESSITNVRGDLDTLQHKMSIAQNQMQAVQNKLVKTQQDLTERTQIFRDRLVSVYVNGQVSYLEVLFSATDMHDFLVRLDLLSRLVQEDTKLMGEIDQKVVTIDRQKHTVSAKKARLAVLKNDTQAMESQLVAKAQEKKIVMGQIKAEKIKAKQELDQLQQASDAIAAEIRKIQAAAKRVHRIRKPASQGTSGSSSNVEVTRSNGQFVWPVPGHTNITSPFGWRIHPILKTRRMHTGVDFGAPYGATVVAADAGTVIFTGPYGAFGNVVIIDHGSNLSTMYCHLSSISVSKGQDVRAGEKVGNVGSTGLSTGPHAHFEVRVNGKPVNPMNYL